eukprot:403346388
MQQNSVSPLQKTAEKVAICSLNTKENQQSVNKVPNQDSQIQLQKQDDKNSLSKHILVDTDSSNTIGMTKNQVIEYYKIPVCYSVSSHLSPSVILELCFQCFKKHVFDFDFVKTSLSDLTEKFGGPNNLTFDNPITIEITSPDDRSKDFKFNRDILENYEKHSKALIKTQDYIKILNKNCLSDTQKKSSQEIQVPFLNCDKLKEEINLKVNQSFEMIMIEQQIIVLETLEEMGKQFKKRIQKICQFKKAFIEMNQSDPFLDSQIQILAQSDNSSINLNESPKNTENPAQSQTSSSDQYIANETYEFNGVSNMEHVPLLVQQEYFTIGFDNEIQILKYDKFCEFHKKYLMDVQNKLKD